MTLNRIQYFALKIASKSWSSSHPTLLSSLNIPYSNPSAEGKKYNLGYYTNKNYISHRDTINSPLGSLTPPYGSLGNIPATIFNQSPVEQPPSQTLSSLPLSNSGMLSPTQPIHPPHSLTSNTSLTPLNFKFNANSVSFPSDHPYPTHSTKLAS